MPRQEWRYFVISFEGSNFTMAMLQRVFDVTRAEIEVGFTATFENSGHGMTWHPGRMFHVLEQARLNPSFLVDIDDEDIREAQTVYSQLQGHDHSLLDVTSPISQVGQLKGLPHHSPLRFLGYFAILESLLTHTPNPTDPYDSITRQVKKKIKLLDRRSTTKINYSVFDEANPERIWTMMYRYRSAVAHGDNPDFKKELKMLQNPESALSLVKETVKNIVRLALVEPQLLCDLKDC